MQHHVQRHPEGISLLSRNSSLEEDGLHDSFPLPSIVTLGDEKIWKLMLKLKTVPSAILYRKRCESPAGTPLPGFWPILVSSQHAMRSARW